MGLGRIASALAKGIDGYTDGLEYKDRKARQAKEDAWRDSERQAVIEERKRNADMRKGLADAVLPAQVDPGFQVTDDAGSNAFTKDADAAAVMQDMAGTVNEGAGLSSATRVNQTAYADPAQAKQATDAYNADGATLRRASAAVMPFDPARGLQLQTGAGQAEEQDRQRRERFKAEGVAQTVRAMRTGDAKAVKDAFNAGGEYKIDGDMTVKNEKRKAPWGEEVDTFTYTGTVIDAKGNKHQITRNSLDMLTQAIPFKDLFETESEAGIARGKHQMSLKEIEARGAQERQTEGVKVRTTSANNAPSREERLRYTSLFSEAGKRMSEAQTTLSKLQGDPAFMVFANKPGSPQAQQLQSLNDAIKSYAEERSLYQGLLAQSQTPEGPGLRNAAPGPANASEAGLRPKVAGDMGAAPGARDREIQQARADLENTSDPAARKMLQDHIAQMEAQNGKYGGQRSTKPADPVKVTSAAEHAALAKGTRYIAPNGQTYIKK